MLCSFGFGADTARGFPLEFRDNIGLELKMLREFSQIGAFDLADLFVRTHDRECQRIQVLARSRVVRAGDDLG